MGAQVCVPTPVSWLCEVDLSLIGSSVPTGAAYYLGPAGNLEPHKKINPSCPALIIYESKHPITTRLMHLSRPTSTLACASLAQFRPGQRCIRCEPLQTSYASHNTSALLFIRVGLKPPPSFYSIRVLMCHIRCMGSHRLPGITRGKTLGSGSTPGTTSLISISLGANQRSPLLTSL